MRTRFIGPQHQSRQRVGRSTPPPMSEAALSREMEWEPDAAPDSAAVEERLKAIAKSMPFAIALLGKSKDDLIAVVEAVVEEGGPPAVLALMKEVDTGAADLDALLELVNAARFRLSSAVANVYPDGVDEAGSPR
jgi:hypothetical protein